jgi:hypothetical protein
MAFNLVDSFKSLITLEVVDKAAAQFGENQAGISKAISGVVPVILTGFVHQAQTGEAGSLLQEAKDAASNNLSNFSEGSSVLSKGEEWLNRMFGNRAGSIGDSLASFADIKTSSAHSLLAMLVPAGLGVIGKHALDNNLSDDGFSSFLLEQRSNIKSAIPAGLQVGLDDWLDRDHHRVRSNAPAGASAAAAAHHASTGHHASAASHHHATVRKPRSTNWVLILILLLLAIALVWYFLVRNPGATNTGNGTSDTAAITVTIMKTCLV